MADEKIMILKMLEEGKISAEQASKLLDAVSPSTPPRDTKRSSERSSASTGTRTADSAKTYERSTSDTRPYESSSGGARSAGYTGTSNSQNRPGEYREPSSRRTEGFDDFVSDMSRRFETFARDVEPTLQKITDVVAEKTADVADRLAKTFSSPPPSEPPRAYSAPRPAAPAASSSSGAYEKSFEVKINTGYNELNLSGLNGNVLIKGYNGDKITAKVSYRPKRGASAAIELVQLGNKYHLSYNEDAFDKVFIDAYIPEGMFNSVNISNINGLVDISSIRTSFFTVYNSSGETRLKDIYADNIKSETDNGALVLSGLKGKNASFDHYNGSIQAYDLDVGGLRLATGNGGIDMRISSLNMFDDYIWQIETSNNKISSFLPGSTELGYHIKANASLGNIRIGLTGMSYIMNSASLVEAKSVDFDRASKKVKISLETSNGTINVD